MKWRCDANENGSDSPTCTVARVDRVAGDRKDAGAGGGAGGRMYLGVPTSKRTSISGLAGQIRADEVGGGPVMTTT